MLRNVFNLRQGAIRVVHALNGKKGRLDLVQQGTNVKASKGVT
jgi:hypothetical protein